MNHALLRNLPDDGWILDKCFGFLGLGPGMQPEKRLFRETMDMRSEINRGICAFEFDGRNFLRSRFAVRFPFSFGRGLRVILSAREAAPHLGLNQRHFRSHPCRSAVSAEKIHSFLPPFAVLCQHHMPLMQMICIRKSSIHKSLQSMDECESMSNRSHEMQSHRTGIRLCQHQTSLMQTICIQITRELPPKSMLALKVNGKD
jgi:hypothetical protein